MPLTSKKTAALDTSSTVKAARRARAASSAAAANATSAAQSAAAAAQNAAGLAQTAARNAAVVATNAAQNAGVLAQNASAKATDAAQNASDVAQTTASTVSKGVRQRVYSARSWAAPRLDDAAEYCTTTVAPKVAAALHSTARQVRPADVRSKKRSILTWSLLGGAILAALGATAAAIRYRYRAAIAADSEAADEEEVLADSTGSQAAPASPDGEEQAKTPKDPGSDASVNGRVTTTGW